MFDINTWLRFDEFITPKVVKFFYFIGLVLVVLGFLFTLVTGLGITGMGFSLLTLVLAFVYLVLGIIGVRIGSEMVLLAFETFRRLGEIRDRLPPR
ncbi:DUF4282 domain-containing protein [Oleomonas cavernae]|uniref:DUF4282 domain-containing protein n=1 Tax=Oleomonas cavernae TaxID=2320859 RepID=A0A418WCX5_9PROT|nr:DUF4282 domain-containing protein [Oleomonas cavernae]RJF87891.1 DUF4282 domain-containing protein [Oleomonas cavernae]